MTPNKSTIKHLFSSATLVRVYTPLHACECAHVCVCASFQTDGGLFQIFLSSTIIIVHTHTQRTSNGIAPIQMGSGSEGSHNINSLRNEYSHYLQMCTFTCIYNNDNNNNFRVSNIRVSNRTLIYNVCPEAALT